ncbi:hypothetical protein KIN20_018420, partial [Parelaphostrongylus tenuis]
MHASSSSPSRTSSESPTACPQRFLTASISDRKGGVSYVRMKVLVATETQMPAPTVPRKRHWDAMCLPTVAVNRLKSI